VTAVLLGGYEGETPNKNVRSSKRKDMLRQTYEPITRYSEGTPSEIVKFSGTMQHVVLGMHKDTSCSLARLSGKCLDHCHAMNEAQNFLDSCKVAGG
jgi:hypothetical protein